MGILLLVVFSLAVNFFIDTENNKNVSAKKEPNKLSQYEQDERYNFIQNVTKELKAQGYKSAGIILVEDYGSRMEFIILCSKSDIKASKLKVI